MSSFYQAKFSPIEDAMLGQLRVTVSEYIARRETESVALPTVPDQPGQSPNMLSSKAYELVRLTLSADTNDMLLSNHMHIIRNIAEYCSVSCESGGTFMTLSEADAHLAPDAVNPPPQQCMFAELIVFEFQRQRTPIEGSDFCEYKPVNLKAIKRRIL